MGNALKICWQCRSECDSFASVCPHCKARLGPRKANGLASRRLGWLAWTGIGCGGLFLLSVLIPLFIATAFVHSEASKGLDARRAQVAEARELSKDDLGLVEKRFNSLKPSFTRNVDKFNGGILWRHKAFSPYVNGNGTTLSTDIWNGEIRLTASFQGSDWIFFRELTVKANGATADADGRPEHHVQSGVTEYLHIQSAQAGPILNLIKAAGDGPVEVRLSGKFTKDFTLKAAHKKAIQDTITFLADLDTLRQAGKVPKGVD